MDDLDPELKEGELEDEEAEDELVPGIKKPKEVDEDSLDTLADEEDSSPEDSYDDAEPEDRW